MSADVITEDEAGDLARTGHFVQAEMGSFEQDGATIYAYRWVHRVNICDACDNGRQYDPIPAEPDPNQMDLPF